MKSLLLYNSDWRSTSSQVVEFISEGLIVVELLHVTRIEVVGLFDDAMAVETVVVLCNLVSILAWSWHFDGA